MIRVHLDAFTRYNVKFYLANLIAINEVGAEYVIRIGEFTSTSRVEELFEAASKCRTVHLPQINAHIAIGKAEALARKQGETK